jgi:hypothetical protein
MNSRREKSESRKRQKPGFFHAEVSVSNKGPFLSAPELLKPKLESEVA